MRMLILAAAAAFLLSGGASAAPQWPCGSYDAIVERLAGSQQQVSLGNGLNTRGMILEIFAAPDGSWSIVMSSPMLSCVVDRGENWRQVEPQQEGEGT